jgi:hypothetical protein
VNTVTKSGWKEVTLTITPLRDEPQKLCVFTFPSQILSTVSSFDNVSLFPFPEINYKYKIAFSEFCKSNLSGGGDLEFAARWSWERVI